MSRTLTLFSTLAVKKAFDDILIQQFTQKTGIEIGAVYDPTTQLIVRIRNGERPDLMIAVTGSFEELRGQDVIDLDTLTPITRVGVGLAVPADAGLPDISTVDALKSTLLSARSVAYSETGASGIYFAQMLRDLGIAEEVNSRATIPQKGFIAQTLVDGRADIAIQQLSELAFVPEAQIVGGLPDDVQNYTEFSVALGTTVAHDPDAKSFVDFLSSEDARLAYSQTRLEPFG